MCLVTYATNILQVVDGTSLLLTKQAGLNLVDGNSFTTQGDHHIITANK